MIDPLSDFELENIQRAARHFGYPEFDHRADLDEFVTAGIEKVIDLEHIDDEVGATMKAIELIFLCLSHNLSIEDIKTLIKPDEDTANIVGVSDNSIIETALLFAGYIVAGRNLDDGRLFMRSEVMRRIGTENRLDERCHIDMVKMLKALESENKTVFELFRQDMSEMADGIELVAKHLRENAYEHIASSDLKEDELDHARHHNDSELERMAELAAQMRGEKPFDTHNDDGGTSDAISTIAACYSGAFMSYNLGHIDFTIYSAIAVPYKRIQQRAAEIVNKNIESIFGGKDGVLDLILNKLRGIGLNGETKIVAVEVGPDGTRKIAEVSSEDEKEDES